MPQRVSKISVRRPRRDKLFTIYPPTRIHTHTYHRIIDNTYLLAFTFQKLPEIAKPSTKNPIEVSNFTLS